MNERMQVYAILRFDDYLVGHTALESCVTVKKIVASEQEAEREVERLNGLVNDDGVRYLWQATRYFPEV